MLGDLTHWRHPHDSQWPVYLRATPGFIFTMAKEQTLFLNGDYQHLEHSSSICWQYKRYLCLIVNLLSNVCVRMSKHTHARPDRHGHTHGLTQRVLDWAVVGKLPSGHCCLQVTWAMSKFCKSRSEDEQNSENTFSCWGVLWLLRSTLFLAPLITCTIVSMVTVLKLNKNVPHYT